MSVIHYPQPRLAGCPTCDAPATSIEFRAGMMERGMNGTWVGTYPSTPPATLIPLGPMRHLEPFSAKDEYVVQPCGHQITAEESEALRERLTRA